MHKKHCFLITTIALTFLNSAWSNADAITRQKATAILQKAKKNHEKIAFLHYLLDKKYSLINRIITKKNFFPYKHFSHKIDSFKKKKKANYVNMQFNQVEINALKHRKETVAEYTALEIIESANYSLLHSQLILVQLLTELKTATDFVEKEMVCIEKKDISDLISQLSPSPDEESDKVKTMIDKLFPTGVEKPE